MKRLLLTLLLCCSCSSISVPVTQHHIRVTRDVAIARGILLAPIIKAHFETSMSVDEIAKYMAVDIMYQDYLLSLDKKQ